MGVSRSAATMFADRLGIDLTLDDGNVKGELSRPIEVLPGLMLPFKLTVIASFGTRSQRRRGADAGLVLRGPGRLGVIAMRHDDELYLRLVDIAELGVSRLRDWFRALAAEAEESEAKRPTFGLVMMATASAERGTWVSPSDAGAWRVLEGSSIA